MADPRDTVDFEGIGGRYVTYSHDNTIVYDADEAGGAAQVGLAVTQTGAADNQVSLVGDGEKVLGKLVLVESDGFCTVQTDGYTTLPGGSGATLTIGSAIVGDLGAASAEGYIQAGTTAGIARGSIVNNDDTAAVKVRLDS